MSGKNFCPYAFLIKNKNNQIMTFNGVSKHCAKFKSLFTKSHNKQKLIDWTRNTFQPGSTESNQELKAAVSAVSTVSALSAVSARLAVRAYLCSNGKLLEKPVPLVLLVGSVKVARVALNNMALRRTDTKRLQDN